MRSFGERPRVLRCPDRSDTWNVNDMMVLLRDGAYLDRIAVMEALITSSENLQRACESPTFFECITNHYHQCETPEERVKLLELISLSLRENSSFVDENILHLLLEILPENVDDDVGKEFLYFILYSLYSFLECPRYSEIFRDNHILERLLHYGGLSEETNVILMVMGIQCAQAGKNLSFAKSTLSFRSPNTADVTLVLLENLASRDPMILSEPGVFDYLTSILVEHPDLSSLVLNLCTCLNEKTIGFMESPEVKTAIHSAIAHPGDNIQLYDSGLKALLRMLVISKSRAEPLIQPLIGDICTRSSQMPFKSAMTTAKFVAACMRYIPNVILSALPSLTVPISIVFQSSEDDAIEAMLLGLEYFARYMSSTTYGVIPLVDCLSSDELTESIEAFASSDNENIAEAAQEILNLFP